MVQSTISADISHAKLSSQCTPRCIPRRLNGNSGSHSTGRNTAMLQTTPNNTVGQAPAGHRYGIITNTFFGRSNTHKSANLNTALACPAAGPVCPAPMDEAEQLLGLQVGGVMRVWLPGSQLQIQPDVMGQQGHLHAYHTLSGFTHCLI